MLYLLAGNLSKKLTLRETKLLLNTKSDKNSRLALHKATNISGELYRRKPFGLFSLVKWAKSQLKLKEAIIDTDSAALMADKVINSLFILADKPMFTEVNQPKPKKAKRSVWMQFTPFEIDRRRH